MQSSSFAKRPFAKRRTYARPKSNENPRKGWHGLRPINWWAKLHTPSGGKQISKWQCHQSSHLKAQLSCHETLNLLAFCQDSESTCCLATMKFFLPGQCDFSFTPARVQWGWPTLSVWNENADCLWCKIGHAGGPVCKPNEKPHLATMWLSFTPRLRWSCLMLLTHPCSPFQLWWNFWAMLGNIMSLRLQSTMQRLIFQS